MWQYFTNLTEANILGKPEWKLEYKASTAFGIPDVSTASLQKLVESFNDANSDNFAKYYKYNSVSLSEQCDSACKREQLCAITKVDFDEYDSCLAASPTTSSSPKSSTPRPTPNSPGTRLRGDSGQLLALAFVVVLINFATK